MINPLLGQINADDVSRVYIRFVAVSNDDSIADMLRPPHKNRAF
jgi:hypothetical protein